MSYILDALRKSERDRRAGAVQSVVDMPIDSEDQTAGKPWLAILIAVLICINLVTLLVVFLYNREPSAPIVSSDRQPDRPEAKPKTRSHSEAAPNTIDKVAVEVSSPVKDPKPDIESIRPNQEQIRPSQPVKNPVKNTAAPNRTAQPPAKVQDKPSKIENKIVHRAQIDPSEPAAKEVVPALQGERPTVSAASPSVPTNRESSKSQFVDRNAQASTEPTKVKPRLQTVEKKPSRIPPAVEPNKPGKDKPVRKTTITAKASTPIAKTKLPAAPSTRSTIPQPAPPKPEEPEPSVPFLKDLPRDFQRQVPKMNINVFVYSDNIDERFVIINMVKYKNGQQLREGPIIEDIRPDSIVLKYRDLDFRVNRP